MTSVGQRLSAEEFARLPDDPSGGRMELAYGEVVMAPPPNAEHGEIAGHIHVVLAAALRSQGASRVIENSGFVLTRGPDIVRAPDVAVVEQFPTKGRTSAGYIEGPPELAIEVVSPSDSASQVEQKVHEYLRAGARRVWVVWPGRRAVTVHRPDGTAVTHEQDATLNADDAGLDLAEFALPLRQVFPADSPVT